MCLLLKLSSIVSFWGGLNLPVPARREEEKRREKALDQDDQAVVRGLKRCKLRATGASREAIELVTHGFSVRPNNFDATRPHPLEIGDWR